MYLLITTFHFLKFSSSQVGLERWYSNSSLAVLVAVANPGKCGAWLNWGHFEQLVCLAGTCWRAERDIWMGESSPWYHSSHCLWL